MHALPKPGSALRLAGLILTAAVITAVTTMPIATTRR